MTHSIIRQDGTKLVAATVPLGTLGVLSLWNLVLTFILARVGEFGQRGRLMALAIATLIVGHVAGPLIAAWPIGDGHLAAEAVRVGIFLTSLLLLAPVIGRHSGLLSNPNKLGHELSVGGRNA